MTDTTAANYCTRKAVKYYGKAGTADPSTKKIASADLAGGATDDGLSRWTASLAHTIAQSNEDAESTVASKARTKAGEVKYREGEVKATNWKRNQRSREYAFYSTVYASTVTAKVIAI